MSELWFRYDLAGKLVRTEWREPVMRFGSNPLFCTKLVAHPVSFGRRLETGARVERRCFIYLPDGVEIDQEHMRALEDAVFAQRKVTAIG